MNSLLAQKNDNETVKKELEEAFAKMWKNTTFTNANDYFKTDVADDYFTNNADGISQTKEELFADKDRLKMLEMATFEFYDKKIRIYGNVGIINGRSKAFFDGKYVAEFLYTAVFVKENDIWKYTSWQGTYSKNSPTPELPMLKN
ncbi:hypothetical protein CSW08_14275 [Confluentibacter flavum]|uniref:DUF4440 domain-containing protein n=2 Tax=Confluentibacter flavum TaxID=1909700 RepID=A0A2N3HH74_9FLAO|nr:hypothetical protein CSW08_14275 [Confluentibacter flavum]